MSDLIDREYAIKRFCEDGTYLERHGVGMMTLCEAKQRAVDLIESFPSAQPEWIPCSERLPEHPENDDYYLVTIQCEHYDGWDDYVTGFAEWTKHGWDELSCYIGQIKVIAWMPLPKPYGGENDKQT